MNSLNLLSAKVIGQASSATRPRSRSQGEALSTKESEELLRGRSHPEGDAPVKQEEDNTESSIKSEDAEDLGTEIKHEEDETKPLIPKQDPQTKRWYRSNLKGLVKRIADALTALLKVLGAPIVYVVQSFQDENGTFSAFVPFRRVRRKNTASTSTASAIGLSNAPEEDEKYGREKAAKRTAQDGLLKHSDSTDSLRSTTSESESDRKRSKPVMTSSKPTRKTREGTEEPRRQSIRIKLHNEEAAGRRKSTRRTQTGSSVAGGTLTVDNIKSPTSPSSTLKLTRYPHAPQPPRPLTPRRQPSYSNVVAHAHLLRNPSTPSSQKTLILDLDETLIHSLAKGARMSTGHMVEVKLNAPVALSPPHSGGQAPAIIGPHHPILYYVHKRPHCDEFLRKVSKWYKLVIFTASVQEYADPVIDWLETERKYFVARYYRQHCTFRQGAYVKDLGTIEPDLSRVVILDNSPVSYAFHQGKKTSMSDRTSAVTERLTCTQTMQYPLKAGSMTLRTVI